MTTKSVPLGEIIKTAAVLRAGDEHLPVLTMTSARGLVRQDEFFKKQIASRDVSKYKVVRPGQIVVGIHVDEGAIGVSKPGDHGVVSPAYTLWDISEKSQVDHRYLDRFIRSPRARQYFIANYRQTAQRRGKMTKDKFLALEVPLPPIEEQRRIAAVLDAADALRAKRRQALAKLDTLTQAIFADLFGELGEPGFTRTPLAEVLVQPLRNGISPAKSGEVAADVLTLSAITHETFDPSAIKQSTFSAPHAAEKTVQREDFLICRGNGNLSLVGRGKFPHQDMPGVAFPDTMIAARVDHDRVSRGFLAHVWEDRTVRVQLEANARTTNGTHKINQTMIEAVELLLPPIEAQREFDRRLGSIEEERRRQHDSAEWLGVLFASLQQRAFRGEL